MKQNFKVGDFVRNVCTEGIGFDYAGKIVFLAPNEVHIKRKDGCRGSGINGSWISSGRYLERVNNNVWIGGIKKRKEVIL